MSETILRGPAPARRPMAPAAGARLVLGLAAIFAAGLLLRYWAFRLDPAGDAGYLESLCIWSCEWYRSIVGGGYDTALGLHGGGDRANWAYFPLYPLLVRLLVAATGLPVLVAGAVVSGGAVFLAALAARPLFAGQAGAYWLFAVGLLAGPFSFLFSTLYSEGLFILLTVLVLVALQRSAYLPAAGFGALLSATRPTGVLIVFAILVQMLVDHRRDGGSWRSFPGRVLGDVRLLLPLFLAPLGLFLYMAYLHLHVGDALAFAHIQRAWGRELGSPLATLGDVLARGVSVELQSMVLLSWAAAAVIGFGLSAILFRRRPAAAVFCCLCLLVSLTSGIGSMVRFVAGLAPLGLVAAELLARWRPLAHAATAAAMLLGMILTYGRLHGSTFAM